MLGQGIAIFIYLAILTGLEFFVAISFGSIPLLVVVALVKAALVVYYYMHVYKLNLEAEHESPRPVALPHFRLIRLRRADDHAY